MLSPIKISVFLALLGLSTASPLPTPASTPTSTESAPSPIVTLGGTSGSYDFCGKLRTIGNARCIEAFKDKPYNPAGPTSGDCITKSAAHADECIKAVDQKKVFTYSFAYPAAATEAPGATGKADTPTPNSRADTDNDDDDPEEATARWGLDSDVSAKKAETSRMAVDAADDDLDILLRLDSDLLNSDSDDDLPKERRTPVVILHTTVVYEEYWDRLSNSEKTGKTPGCGQAKEWSVGRCQELSCKNPNCKRRKNCKNAAEKMWLKCEQADLDYYETNVRTFPWILNY
ncbi:hypothetical protein HDU96_000573 [Phlyctochytrium bullatum]|nr:hypothetical protein HDU96_000573 [Phlyctochytrium bullatum]